MHGTFSEKYLRAPILTGHPVFSEKFQRLLSSLDELCTYLTQKLGFCLFVFFSQEVLNPVKILSWPTPGINRYNTPVWSVRNIFVKYYWDVNSPMLGLLFH